MIWCQWVEDPCQGPTCRYAICARGQLQKDLTCGLSIRREYKEVEEEPSMVEDELSLSKTKIKSRTLKKIKELDY